MVHGRVSPVVHAQPAALGSAAQPGTRGYGPHRPGQAVLHASGNRIGCLDPVVTLRRTRTARAVMGYRTALYEKHCEAGARIVDFAGWDMPLQYGSQIE